jgi:hypothetical protein
MAAAATKPVAAAAAAKPVAPPMQGKNLQSTISNIAKSNKIANVNKIYAGKTLDLGTGSKYTIQKGDTLTKIAKNLGTGSQAAAPKSSVASNNADIATQVAKTPLAKPESVATSTGMKSTNINDMNKSVNMSPKTSGAPTTFQNTAPSPAKNPDLGSASAMAADVEKKKAEGPAKTPTVRPMQECVQVGDNKYRIV